MTRTGGASSHLDTLSGHEEDHDRKHKRESVSVTIQEAARRCGVNPKTIQRAIRAGTLPARYPLPNRCEIAVSDLDMFMPGHVQIATKHPLAEQVPGHVQAEMEQRVAALEQRIQQLERLVTELLNMPAAPKRQSRAKARESTRAHYRASASAVRLAADLCPASQCRPIQGRDPCGQGSVAGQAWGVDGC